MDMLIHTGRDGRGPVSVTFLHTLLDMLDSASAKLRGEVEQAFSRLGLLLVDHACKFVLVGLLFTVVCCGGMMRLEFVTNVNELLLRQDSPEARDYFRGEEIFKDELPEEERALEVLYSVPRGVNILDSPHLEAALEIHRKIQFDVEAEGKNFQEHCNRYFDNRSLPCVVFCPLMGFNILNLTSGRPGFRNTTSMLMGERARVEQGLDPEDDDGHFEYTDSFICKYESKSDEFKTEGVKWIGENRDVPDSEVRVSAYSFVHASGETIRGGQAEAHLWLISIFLIWLGCNFALHTVNRENHRWINPTNMMAASMCVLSAMLSVATALGILGWARDIGGKTSVAALYVIYFCLGVSVDDMMILVTLFWEAPKDLDIRERAAACFGAAAMSITLTSFTTCCGFICGALVDVMVIQTFCILGALATLTDYVLQLTLFAGSFIAWQRRYNKEHQATRDASHGHSCIGRYARWSVKSVACRMSTFFVLLALFIASWFGAWSLEVHWTLGDYIPDDSPYHKWVKDGQEYMGEMGRFPIYMVMQHQVLPGPDTLRATAEHAQRIRELRDQKPYKTAAADWTQAMAVWDAVQPRAERERIRTNTTAFGLAMADVLNGKTSQLYMGLSAQWADLSHSYSRAEQSVEGALAHLDGIADVVSSIVHYAVAEVVPKIREAQQLLNATRHAYGNLTLRLGPLLQAPLQTAASQLRLVATAHLAVDVGASQAALAQAGSALRQAPLGSLSEAGLASEKRRQTVESLKTVAGVLREAVQVANATVSQAAANASAAFADAAESLRTAWPSNDAKLPIYWIQVMQREYLRQLGDIMQFVSDPMSEVAIPQWVNATLLPLELVVLQAESYAHTLEVVGNVSDFFNERASDYLLRIADVANLSAASLNGTDAENAALVQEMASILDEAAMAVDAEAALAGVEQHYEAGQEVDLGADDVCSTRDVALASFRRGLAYGVAHRRSEVLWEAYANYTVAKELSELATDILSQSRQDDPWTPQVQRSIRRFIGLQIMGLAEERRQVQHERASEREVDRAFRAVEAATRLRLAEEYTKEWVEVLDNREEDFGQDMRIVIHNADLQPAMLRVQEVKFPDRPQKITEHQAWLHFRLMVNGIVREVLLDDLEDRDPTDARSVLFDNQAEAAMVRLRRARARQRTVQDRMYFRTAASWESNEAFLHAFDLSGLLQERQAARKARFGDRPEDESGQFLAYKVPQPEPGDLLSFQLGNAQSSGAMAASTNVGPIAQGRMQRQAGARSASELLAAFGGAHAAHARAQLQAGAGPEVAAGAAASILGIDGLRAAPPGDLDVPGLFEELLGSSPYRYAGVRIQLARLHDEQLRSAAESRESGEDLRDAQRLARMDLQLGHEIYRAAQEWLGAPASAANTPPAVAANRSCQRPELHMGYLGHVRRQLDQMEREMDFRGGSLSEMALDALGRDLGYLRANLSQVAELWLGTASRDAWDNSQLFGEMSIVLQMLSASVRADVVMDHDASRDLQGLPRVFYTRLKAHIRARQAFSPKGFEEDKAASLQAQRIAAEWVSQVRELHEGHLRHDRDFSLGDPWELNETFSYSIFHRHVQSKDFLYADTIRSVIYVNIVIGVSSILTLGPRVGLTLVPLVALMVFMILGLYGTLGFKINQSFSLVIIMASGNTVDYIYHYAVAVASCTPANPLAHHVSGEARYVVGIKSAGLGVLCAYATSILGIAVLPFGNLRMIRELFQGYVVSLNLSVFFGLLVAPFTLSYVYGLDLRPQGEEVTTKPAQDHEVHGPLQRLIYKK